MLSESRRLVSALFLATLLVPCLARAQSVAESFDQLQKLLKADDVVVVTSNGGTQTTGRVTEIASNSLTITVMTSEGRATWRTSGTQTFAGSDVALIHRSDLSTDARVLVYTANGPFQPLQGRLKVGQKALVLTSSGRTISGRVTELSPSALVLTNGTIKQIVDASEVAIVKKPGPIWDGAVKGGVIGLVAMWVLLSPCHGCGNGQFAMLGMGVGAAIGLGIDAAFGPKTIYKVPPARRISLAPVVGKDRRAFSASIRF